MKKRHHQFILTLLFSISALVSAQSISTKIEKVIITSDTLYTRDITVYIKANSEDKAYPIIYDGKLEKVSNIVVYEKKGKRYKQNKHPEIHDETINSALISSQKLKTVTFPSDTEIKICYTISCNELVYFSSLPLFTYQEIDTFHYQISIPDAFHLSYDIANKDSLSYLSKDSLRLENSVQWTFKSAPINVEPNPLIYLGIYKDIKVPLLRIAVKPTGAHFNQIQHFNNWYLEKAKKTRGLDTNGKNKIDDITFGITDSIEIINVLYDYVRTNFKYVAIEIGMGAFIPSHTNEVFTNKQGDCKDLSNFLLEALSHKGIKSSLALAATHQHICDCDFPSISSANHVVCVAYIGGEPIILDPTDPVHRINTPVQGIQERTLLIIDSLGGEFHKLNRYEGQKNLVDYRISMNVSADKTQMLGDFQISYSGISGNFLRWTHLEHKGKEATELYQKHYESIFKNQFVNKIEVKINDDKISVTGDLRVNMNIFNDKSWHYLFLDFVPRLFETEDRETLSNGSYLGATIDRKVRLTVNMNEPIEDFQPIKHSFIENGTSLELTATVPKESTIEYNYELLIDHIFINNENQETINGLIQSFKKITNEPVVFKIKE